LTLLNCNPLLSATVSCVNLDLDLDLDLFSLIIGFLYFKGLFLLIHLGYYSPVLSLSRRYCHWLGTNRYCLLRRVFRGRRRYNCLSFLDLIEKPHMKASRILCFMIFSNRIIQIILTWIGVCINRLR